MSDFINYACENYPADKYGLILWDHGGGSVGGYGEDEVSLNSMSLEQLGAALEATPFKEDQKLEFIGFDACLMGTVEVADTLKNYSKYLIASEESEPGHGWDYSFLGELDGAYDGVSVGKLIVDHYLSRDHIVRFYESHGIRGGIPNDNLTMSVVDTQKIDALNASVNKLFGKLYARFDGGTSYQVPDGVEIIERYACVGDPYHGDQKIDDILTQVVIPDSVKTILSDAFRDAALTELVIPGSVVYIANGAFANYRADTHPTITQLTIGKGLEFLGIGVFNGVAVENVKVSADNEHFSDVNGKLMNKAGDAEIALQSQ